MLAKDLIQTLGLKPLEPEGGYFTQTYISQADENILTSNGKRPLSSCIYYLIDHSNFSRLHRLKSDEIYHFYYGFSAELVIFSKETSLINQTLGTHFLAGERPQIIVPKNSWQGLKIKNSKKDAFALLGTTVSPAFSFDDFEIAKKENLLAEYPQYADIINEYT